jgi:CrcB protein
MLTVGKLAILSVAGALGTLARYGTYALSARYFGDRYPVGTVFVNLLGAFLFGWIWAISERFGRSGPDLRLFVLTGFMGAYTTFSTFASDVARLAAAGEWGIAAGNLVLQNLGGCLAIVAGWSLAR